MKSKNIAATLVTVTGLAVLAAAGHAQQQPSGDSSQPRGAASQAMTIDCPREAAAAPATQVIGNPPGSGLAALPADAQTQRVEGPIKAIDSSRTNRIIEVGDVKLEVEPTTVVLVGCKAASVADLKVGTQIKAAYEEKAPNRHLAKVIEAQN